MTEIPQPDKAAQARDEKDRYADEIMRNVRTAQEHLALVLTIDGDGAIAVSSPMGYGRRQAAAMLETIARKITDEADADGVPPLSDDETPGDARPADEIPDGALRTHDLPDGDPMPRTTADIPGTACVGCGRPLHDTASGLRSCRTENCPGNLGE